MVTATEAPPVALGKRKPMNEKPDPKNDELDDAIINADDTGMVANQHLIVAEEVLLGSNDPRIREGEEPQETEQPPSP